MKVETDLIWIATAALFIAFWGTPDLVDAIIYHLTDGNAGLPVETKE